MNVTKNFTLKEFLCKCGSNDCEFKEPTDAQMEKIKKLSNALEMIRIMVGEPIIITSGLRCPAHNKAVGGGQNSQHLTGSAADLKCKKNSKDNLYRIIERLAEDDKINDVPNGGLSKNYDRIVHYDVRTKKARW